MGDGELMRKNNPQDIALQQQGKSVQKKKEGKQIE